jgi:hypothetical protein
MPLIDLNAEQHAALVSGYERAAMRQFAQQCFDLAVKVQRDILALATHCQQMLDAGRHPAAVADYARSATYLATDLSRFTPDKMPLVKQAGQTVYGYTEAEVDAVFAVLQAGAIRLLDTEADGSTIAADVADVLWQFTPPPTIWD